MRRKLGLFLAVSIVSFGLITPSALAAENVNPTAATSTRVVATANADKNGEKSDDSQYNSSEEAAEQAAQDQGLSEGHGDREARTHVDPNNQVGKEAAKKADEAENVNPTPVPKPGTSKGLQRLYVVTAYGSDALILQSGDHWGLLTPAKMISAPTVQTRNTPFAKETPAGKNSV